MPSISSEVAIGRRMKGSEMLIGDHLHLREVHVGRRAAGDSPEARVGGELDSLTRAPWSAGTGRRRPPARRPSGPCRRRRCRPGSRRRRRCAARPYVGLDDIDVIAVRPLLDRLRRHRRRVLERLQDHPQIDELAGPQAFVLGWRSAPSGGSCRSHWSIWLSMRVSLPSASSVLSSLLIGATRRAAPSAWSARISSSASCGTVKLTKIGLQLGDA